MRETPCKACGGLGFLVATSGRSDLPCAVLDYLDWNPKALTGRDPYANFSSGVKRLVDCPECRGRQDILLASALTSRLSRTEFTPDDLMFTPGFKR